jgi:ureidoglycolate amidohydrolase
MTVARFEVDAVEIMAELDALAARSDALDPAVTRVVYTAADLAARTFIKVLCTDAGLSVREDAIGNTFARWEGQRPGLSPVGTGSHIDAIPDSGRFDGTVGVIGGLAAIRSLKRAGFQPVRPVELLIFTSEEPTRFSIGCLGSRALSGSMTPEALLALKDAEGRSFDDIRREAGFHGELANVRLAAGYFASFVELHIEQGPLLEQAGVPIGIVTAIAAPAALRVTWKGEGGHAGTVLMNGRRDALCAAAETVLAVEASARSTESPDTVATTGICRVHPGAINSIPDQVTLEIDIRDVDSTRRDRVLETVRSAVEAIAARRQVAAVTRCLSADPPAGTAPIIVQAIQAACRALGLENLPMVSRAYHDSLFMAGIAPTGMIFIPCRGGMSHRPEEYSEPEAIARGVEVLALTLKELAESEERLAGHQCTAPLTASGRGR